MPSTTTDETRETTERAKAASGRAQRQISEVEDIQAEAVEKLVAAWTELVRMFVPPALLRPEAALRVVLRVVEQGLDLQRRSTEELLVASRDVVVGTEVGHNGHVDHRAA